MGWDGGIFKTARGGAYNQKTALYSVLHQNTPTGPSFLELLSPPLTPPANIHLVSETDGEKNLPFAGSLFKRPQQKLEVEPTLIQAVGSD